MWWWAAWAGTPVSVSATDDLEVRYWVRDERLPDPSDVPVFDYVEQVNRLNLAFGSGAWGLNAQVDQVALLGNRYYLDDVLFVERPLLDPGTWSPLGNGSDVYANLEKLVVSHESDDATLQVGDVYAAFGRGIALNLARNVDIDVDTTIQGVRATVRPGAWEATALAGQLNRQQVFQDNPNIRMKGDLRHLVTGVRVERFGLGPANLAVHGVSYDFVDEPGLQEGFRGADGPDVLVGGASAELFGVGGVDWFVEGDLFGYPSDRLSADGRLGGAAYGSAAFYPGKTVWLVEVKRYTGSQRLNRPLATELYQVAVAPTLEYERAITEDSAAAVGSEDVWGARVRMDWALAPGRFVPYASVGLFRDLELGALHFNDTPETITHPMMGVEWLPEDGAVLFNAGFRTDRRDGGETGADRQLHGDLTVNLPLVLGLTGNLNLGAERFLWGVNPFAQEDYTEVEGAFTVSRGSAVAFTWFTDFSNNPLIDSVGNISETVYAAGELQVKPSSAVTIKAFYGGYKSGIRCSGGQCRLLPGFEGARASVVATF